MGTKKLKLTGMQPEEVSSGMQSLVYSRYYLYNLKNSWNEEYDSLNSKIYKDHFEETFQVIKNRKMYEPVSQEELENKRIVLDEQIHFQKKMILVLDLDETLVHSKYTFNDGAKIGLIKFQNESGVTS